MNSPGRDEGRLPAQGSGQRTARTKIGQQRRQLQRHHKLTTNQRAMDHLGTTLVVAARELGAVAARLDDREYCRLALAALDLAIAYHIRLGRLVEMEAPR